MLKPLISKAASIALVSVSCFSFTNLAQAETLVVYSSKNASYIKPMFDEYSRETGVGISYLIAPTQTLMSRLQIEGAATKADVILGTGVRYFAKAAEQGLLASVNSKYLTKNVPAHSRDENNRWFALSKRARTIIYNASKVNAGELSTYAALADSKWQGRLCMRQAGAEYSQSLVAMLIERYGEDQTKHMLKGWKENLAQAPFDGDEAIVDAITAGQCDVGIVNSYYYARLLRDDPKTRLKLFWPDQDGAGVHMNLTALAVTKHAKNPQQAVDLLEWLTDKRPQSKFAKLSMEYPGNNRVSPAREVGKWGRFKEDTNSLTTTWTRQKQAQQLLLEAGWQ